MKLALSSHTKTFVIYVYHLFSFVRRHDTTYRNKLTQNKSVTFFVFLLISSKHFKMWFCRVLFNYQLCCFLSVCSIEFNYWFWPLISSSVFCWLPNWSLNRDFMITLGFENPLGSHHSLAVQLVRKGTKPESLLYHRR